MNRATTPFSAVWLPQHIDSAGFQRLMDDINGGNERWGTSRYTNNLNPWESLTILSVRLDAQMITVMVLYYGLGDEEAMVMRLIAKRLGVSKTRIGQIRSKALTRMRHLKP